MRFFSLPGRMLAIAALATGLATVMPQAESAAAAEDWPQVKRSSIDRFLFPSNGAANGAGRLARWESDMVLDFYYASGKDYVKELVKTFNDRGLLGNVQVHLLPPASSQGTATADPFKFAVGVNQDFFNLALEPRPELGSANYQQHAKQTGCFAHPAGRQFQNHIISSGRIMARRDLSRSKLRDCILRGMLLTAGLGHTDELAFGNEPLSEADQEEAFKVLRLMYHPSVRPGMTRDQFTAALQGQGLIVE